MLSMDGARLQVFLDLQRRHGLRRGPEELVILDEHTITRPWGWVFFYTTRGWKDGDIRYALGGNAPYMVNRNGSIQFAGTGRPIEDYIRKYETQLEK
jgi:Immunity protein 35